MNELIAQEHDVTVMSPRSERRKQGRGNSKKREKDEKATLLPLYNNKEQTAETPIS